MYYNIKEILKASVCGFCENIYEDNSIDENEFIRYLLDFLYDDYLEECLELITADISYDIENIDNICNDKLYLLKNKHFEDIREIIEHCKNAYLKTLKEDKTINTEAFVDNLTEEFYNIKILKMGRISPQPTLCQKTT